MQWHNLASGCCGSRWLTPKTLRPFQQKASHPQPRTACRVQPWARVDVTGFSDQDNCEGACCAPGGRFAHVITQEIMCAWTLSCTCVHHATATALGYCFALHAEEPNLAALPLHPITFSDNPLRAIP